MQTDVLAKSQGVTLAHRLFTQSFQLCFPNIETAGAYLSRKNISFWKATSVVGAGEEEQSFFFSSISFEHGSLPMSFIPQLKMLFTSL